MLSEHHSWLLSTNNRLDIPFALIGWSRVLIFRGDPGQAARLLGAAQALFDGFQFHPGPDTTLLFERSLEAASAGLSPEEFRATWAEGQLMTLDQAIQMVQAAAGNA